MGVFNPVMTSINCPETMPDEVSKFNFRLSVLFSAVNELLFRITLMKFQIGTPSRKRSPPEKPATPFVNANIGEVRTYVEPTGCKVTPKPFGWSVSGPGNLTHPT